MNVIYGHQKFLQDRSRASVCVRQAVRANGFGPLCSNPCFTFTYILPYISAVIENVWMT